MRKVDKLVYLAMFIAPLLVLSGAWIIVPKQHVGVSNFMGKVSSKPMLPGPRLKVPFFEKVEKIQASEQSFPGDLDAFSGDLQGIKVKYTVRVRLEPEQVPVLYAEYSGTDIKQWFDRQALPEINQSVKEVTARYRLQDMSTQRARIRDEVFKLLQNRVNTMTVTGFTLDNLEPSEKLQEEIERKVIEEQKMLAEDYKTSASAKQAQQKILEAHGEAESIRLKGEALKQNQAVAMLSFIQKWDGKVPGTLVINGSLPPLAESDGSTTTSKPLATSPIPIILNAVPDTP